MVPDGAMSRFRVDTPPTWRTAYCSLSTSRAHPQVDTFHWPTNGNSACVRSSKVIAAHFDQEWELLDVPYEYALPSRAFNFSQAPSAASIASAEQRLDYRDLVPAEPALSQAIEWLLENRPEPGGDVETRIGAIFDYEREDQIIDAWHKASAEMRAALDTIQFPNTALRHVFDDPKVPTATP